MCPGIIVSDTTQQPVTLKRVFIHYKKHYSCVVEESRDKQAERISNKNTYTFTLAHTPAGWLAEEKEIDGQNDNDDNAIFQKTEQKRAKVRSHHAELCRITNKLTVINSRPANILLKRKEPIYVLFPIMFSIFNGWLRFQKCFIAYVSIFIGIYFQHAYAVKKDR